MITAGLILTIIVAVAIAWTPLRLDRFGLVPMAIDWIDVVKINGTTYKSNHPRQEITAADIGDEIGAIQFTMSGQVNNPHYRIKDGDAAFLPVGTKLYSIKNDVNSIAALINGKYYLFSLSE